MNGEKDGTFSVTLVGLAITGIATLCQAMGWTFDEAAWAPIIAQVVGLLVALYGRLTAGKKIDSVLGSTKLRDLLALEWVKKLLGGSK